MTILLAAFDDHAAAQGALERLVQSGFDRSDLHLEQDLQRLRPGGGLVPEKHEGVLGSLGRVFGDLVQANIDTQAQDLVRAATERGGTVLLARCNDAGRAGQAADLLRAAGAYNVSTGPVTATQ